MQVIWGYALFPDRVGDSITRPTTECSGAQILVELCSHLRIDLDTVVAANCAPCLTPYIINMSCHGNPESGRHLFTVGSRNLGLAGQFVEITDDVVFTVKYSIRATQLTVYQLSDVDRPIPPVTSSDRSDKVSFNELMMDFA